jgi:4'-phosphopantetheinyl transferase
MNDDDSPLTDGPARTGHAGFPIALAPVTPGVALWWSDLAQRPAEIDRIAACLSPDEMARAARFGTAALRSRYIVGRATLRRLLANALGIGPAEVPLRRGIRGRPELAGTGPMPDFNISHTHGGAIIAIGCGLPEGARVGVDVEREDRLLGADRLARKFLSAREQASLPDLDADGRRQRFLRYWTCKEAMSKATGDGLSAPFARLDIDIAATITLRAGPSPYVPGAWHLHTVAVPAGFIGTLAVWSDGGVFTPPSHR